MVALYKLLSIRSPGPSFHKKHKSFQAGPISFRLHLKDNVQSKMINPRQYYLTPERNALLTPTGYEGTHTQFVENYFRADVRTLSKTLSNYDWTRTFNTEKVNSILIKQAGKTETNKSPSMQQ